MNCKEVKKFSKKKKKTENRHISLDRFITDERIAKKKVMFFSSIKMTA